MEIKELDFIPVLLGSDINTYSMARAFHEAYKVKSQVIGKYPTGPSYNSRIIDFTANENIDKQDVFLKLVNEFAREHKNKKIILIGCGDSYVSLVSQNKYDLEKNIIAPYIDYALMDELIKKENFYKMCEKYNIDFPNTFIHKKELGLDFTLPFEAPFILKPSNSVEYWEHPYEGQKKVYKINTRQELNKTITQVYEAGYTDSLIIQDFIPGDDSYMRVLTSYSGRDKKVKLMSLGHVLLEEHTPHGLGNHAIIINEYDEALMKKMREFLEEIEYTGFSNFDIKYDERDGKFKVFEINLRQGRSNFYVTGSGYNVAKYLVEDYIENKPMSLTLANTKRLWLVVPKQVAYKYVKDEKAKAQMKQLIKEKKYVNPLFYKGDLQVKRFVAIFKTHISHFVKYKKYM
jgi:D-aspartate ligase